MYYVFYAYHWIITLVIISQGIDPLRKNSSCELTQSLVYSVIFVTVRLQINSIIGMAGNIHMILKYLHFGGNWIWVGFWIVLRNHRCYDFGGQLIAFFHAVLALFNFVQLIIAKVGGR